MDRKSKKVSVKNPSAHEPPLEKDEARVSGAGLGEERSAPQGKWERDRFGDEHYIGGGLDDGRVQFGRKPGKG